MTDDLAVLAQLNVEIGVAETNGDRAFLDGILAEQLAFRRASGAVVDRPAVFVAFDDGLGDRGRRKDEVMLWRFWWWWFR